MSEAADLDAFLQRAPYIRFLGMRAELADGQITAILPFEPHLVGNTLIPALHGGVIGGFLEATALGQLWITQGSGKLAKTIDITIEYLRPARALTTYARADLRKVGRRVANVHVEAWQDSPDRAVAALRGHFLLRPE